MDQPPPADSADLRVLLPRDAYYVLIHDLHTSLPPPLTDSPEDFARRDNAAIAKVASLLPATAAEAEVAGLFVAASARAGEALRSANKLGADPIHALRCTAQAAAMMRAAQGAVRTLQRLQAERRKQQADATGAQQADWIEHCATGFMVAALGDRPPLAPMEPSPPPPADETQEPVPDPVAEAELYAKMYPERARLIRRHGGMPPDATFDEPDDWLARAVVNGRSPALLALDQEAP
jgi:hypothetical protein